MVDLIQADGYCPDVSEPRGRGRPKKERPAPVEMTDADEERLRREIGQRVRKRRIEMESSMRDLSAASGISVQTIQAVESGKGDPKVLTLLRLSLAMNCAAGWLAFGG